MAIDGIIDIVVNPFTPEIVASRPSWSEGFFADKIGVGESTARGVSMDELVEKMDRAGVAHALLVAARSGPVYHPTSFRLPYELVGKLVAQHPDRFSGLAGIDPTEGTKGVRELQHAVEDLGFIGAHFYPHWFEMAPDHARVYPFYAKCCELDVPIQMQVGNCLRVTAERPLPSVGRPLTLDTVACDFPDLKLVGIRTGWPWTEELIAVAYKHPNVYIGADGYAPKYWSKELVRFIDSLGQDKVLFGTGFPLIEPVRAVREIDELAIRPASLRKFLRQNAVNLYGLDQRLTLD